jgi:hypothetical protein
VIDGVRAFVVVLRARGATQLVEVQRYVSSGLSHFVGRGKADEEQYQCTPTLSSESLRNFTRVCTRWARKIQIGRQRSSFICRLTAGRSHGPRLLVFLLPDHIIDTTTAVHACAYRAVAVYPAANECLVDAQWAMASDRIANSPCDPIVPSKWPAVMRLVNSARPCAVTRGPGLTSLHNPLYRASTSGPGVDETSAYVPSNAVVAVESAWVCASTAAKKLKIRPIASDPMLFVI